MYFISITDEAGQPTLNDWWHLHRKTTLDTDNNAWGNGGTHPVFFGYYDTANAGHYYHGTSWATAWNSAMNYDNYGKWYTFQMEKTATSYIFSVYDALTHSLLKQATIPKSSVLGSGSPDYIAIGDPHTNYYNGSVRITNIQVWPAP
jgi:hypothetical protein